MDLRPNITKIGYAGEMDGFDPAVAAMLLGARSAKLRYAQNGWQAQR